MNHTPLNKVISFKSLIGLALSLFLLWLTIHRSGLGLGEISLSPANSYFLIASILVFLFTAVIYALRSRLVWVSDQRHFANIYAYSSLIIGNFYNCLLPGNLGDGIRAWHFHRKNHVNFSKSIAAIICEKWIDAQLFLPVIMLVLYLKPIGTKHPVFEILSITFIIILITDLFLYLIIARTKQARILWGLIPGRKARNSLFRIFHDFLGHLRHIYSNGHLIGFTLMGYLMFLLNLVQYYLVLKAANISGIETSLFSIYLLGCVMMIVSIIPAAPSSIGVLHYGIYATLCLVAILYNIPLDNHLKQQYALASVYLHLSCFVPETLIGLPFVWRERTLLFHNFKKT